MEPISRIDSTTNQLYFRGINATELAKQSDFESVLHLLIHGYLPSEKQADEIKSKMIGFRDLYSDKMDSLKSLAGSFDKLKVENSLENEDALLAVISLSTIVAATSYVKPEKRMVENPNSDLGHSANFLWMVRGSASSTQDIQDFQTCLILHMDDPDNPSLTALKRVIASGGSIADALGEALVVHSDPLHHGAGTEAMKIFKEIKNQESSRAYLQHRIEKGYKIYGLGHRIYRGFDPRALILRDMLRQRVTNTDNEWLIDVIEETAQQGRGLLLELKGIQAYPNVDLYNAATYTTFGFPPEFNTTLFALSRVAGWVAHILNFQIE
ncbi:citrate/2-methylcitrate synthase [Candidatus Thorarchaeota archaeon]|nr:MAG: citrate/2-methylcitrate synthase [Candidatus Thorarchaeota archaeon]